MTDSFDDPFEGNGGGGGLLGEIEGLPCILVPQEVKTTSAIQDTDGDKEIVLLRAISFEDPDNPEIFEEVAVFGKKMVGTFKRLALKNAKGEVNAKGFPFMKTGIIFQNAEKAKRGNAMWDLKPVEDDSLRAVMIAYAHNNLKAKNPFE